MFTIAFRLIDVLQNKKKINACLRLITFCISSILNVSNRFLSLKQF